MNILTQYKFLEVPGEAIQDFGNIMLSTVTGDSPFLDVKVARQQDKEKIPAQIKIPRILLGMSIHVLSLSAKQILVLLAL